MLIMLFLLMLLLPAKDTATCSDCASGNCPNHILANILQEKKLTSGYIGNDGKPKGINKNTYI